VSKDSLKDVFTHDVLKKAVCQPGELGCIHGNVHHKAAYQAEVKDVFRQRNVKRLFVWQT